jgi:hypothetical protein
MRLSLMKAAHADVGGAPWQEIRVAHLFRPTYAGARGTRPISDKSCGDANSAEVGGEVEFPWEAGCTDPGKDRAVESHISRKTSEMWGTQDLRSGQRFGPSVFGSRGSLVIGRLLRRLVCRLALVLALPGPLLVRRLHGRALFRLALGRA